MAHGDDKGLRLPPKLAPIQVVILPVKADQTLNQFCQKIAEELEYAGYRIKIDTQDERIGWKINKWELKGVPLRIEVGNKELEEGSLTLVRRDTDEKMNINVTDSVLKIGEILEAIQLNLLTQAEAFLKSSTHEVSEWSEFKQRMEGERGFLKAYWCGTAECEATIKEQTKATTRCMAETSEESACIHCGEKANEKWLFAQSY